MVSNRFWPEPVAFAFNATASGARVRIFFFFFDPFFFFAIVRRNSSSQAPRTKEEYLKLLCESWEDAGRMESFVYAELNTFSQSAKQLV